MAHPVLLLACALALLAYSSVASAEIVEHTFHVKNLTVNRLCTQQVINAVNGRLPGPTIKVHEGDTLVVHVFNKSPYNLTIHWHGIFQLLSGWADGPAYATQCPILPRNSYTYKFTITGQEGTLWWHAHFGWLRATVHGALIIRPRKGYSYPFKKPSIEVPILLGEWWNGNVVDVGNQLLPNNSNGYTINGWPGDLYPCSSNSTYKLTVKPRKTYLLRIINAALNNQFFFKIGGHNMTVVAVDASYTAPMVTDVVVVGPGQTTDVLVTFDQPPASYYMAARPFESNVAAPFDNTTTTGIIIYENCEPSRSTPLMPALPVFNDIAMAFKFSSSLTGLVNGPHWMPVPLKIDERMFVTIGLGFSPCESATCSSPFFPPGMRISASMNNASFQFPTKLSMLEAFFNNVGGIYTTDFPDNPPLVYDYTNVKTAFDPSLFGTFKSTKVKRLKFNSTVEMVLQNTAFVGFENHPMHLHGFNFHVLAQGFGNYDLVNGPKQFNLVNPQIRNTIGVPAAGWAVIRFTANNPGVWLMHCHLEMHFPWGLATAFVVENGPTPSTTLPPPPPDLPQC